MMASLLLLSSMHSIGSEHRLGSGGGVGGGYCVKVRKFILLSS